MYHTRLNNYLSVLKSELAILKKSRFAQTKEFIQHGETSVYRHCVAVAYTSCVIAARFHLKVNIRDLVRGALLHDYFLYDWHTPDESHRWHGFTHPKKALRNAQNDFQLTPTEEDIIVKHMFPLTPIPPMKKESWIVTMADKYCAIQEIHL